MKLGGIINFSGQYASGVPVGTAAPLILPAASIPQECRAAPKPGACPGNNDFVYPPLKETPMRIAIALFVATLITGCVSGTNAPSQQKVDTYSIADFMVRLDDAIKPAAVAAVDNGLRLTQVKLTFNVVLTDKTSGEIKILFVKAGGGRTEAQTTEYTVTLSAPASLAQGVGQVSDDKYLRSFSEALEALVADADKYKVGELVTHEVTASLKYFIQQSASGGVDQDFEVVPVSLKAGSTTSEDATQTILLTFQADKAREDSKE